MERYGYDVGFDVASDGVAGESQVVLDRRKRRTGAVNRRWPFISVIVPVKNAASHLAQQMESLARQTYAGKWEVIVVDNGSADDSVAIARAYENRIPGLTVVSATQKSGSAFARNYGASLAKGDALVFCDADDIVGARWLQEMGKALQCHEFVAGGIDVERLNGDAPWRRPVFSGSADVALLFKPIVVGCNIGVSRNAFKKVGGFDEDIPIGEDVDFSWRLQLRGYAIADAPQAVVHYRYRQGHALAARQTVQYAMAHVLLYKRFARHGMPRWPMSWVITEYRWLLWNLDCWVRRGQQARREEWLQRAAERAGRLLGSMRFFAVYL